MNLTHQRIVVTGGAGFLGRVVCAELAKAGVSADNILIPRRAEFDLTCEEAVEQMYARMKPTIVIHLAAEVGGIGANRQNPGRFFHANMAMGLHLIEHARRNTIKKFVQIGTVCSYPKFAPVPFREDDLWNGYPEETNAPYGVAKKALIVMLQSYRAQYGLNGIYLLPVNLYGPGDNFDAATSHVIPALIRKFVEAKAAGAPQVEVWGTGNASREFLYVDDCAKGIVSAAQKYDGDQPVNLGIGEEITIRDLAEKIRTLVGYEGKIAWDTTKPDGQPRRKLETSRAAAHFGWWSETELDDGLRRTIEWYLSKKRIHNEPARLN
ncbi:MAG: GDP-L-fucose synthase [Planctomycetes bacterium]|nr:GDP-L-fucose synthase [Planctomycetota bacterium]